MNFQDQDTQQEGKNPFNANVLKGGKVDPRSKLYQRSIAGREKLDEMLSRLWRDGKPEADVFMAGVRALTSRDKGYVGAYLDSKNPGRRYQENEAMAITDQVMKNLGIGSHPGNRLTREKDEEGKAKRKEENVARGGFGPKQAPGKKAMPVGQQRKEGKRPGTGQPVEGSRREGLGQPETGPRSEWQKTLKDALDGKITAADVVKAFSKEKQSPLSQSPQAQAKRKEKQEARQAKLRQSIAEDKGLRDREAAAGPETEEEFKPTIDGVGIREAFKAFYNKALQRTGLDLKSHVKRLARSREGFSTDLGDIINEIEEKGFKVDPDEFKKAVARSFGVDLDNYPGWDSEIRSEDSPEPAAAPTETAAAPEPSAAGTKEPDAGKLPEKEINDNFLDAFGDYLFDPDSGKTTKTNVNGYIRDVAKNYGVSTQDIVSSIMKDENGARALKRAGFGATSLVRKGDTSPPESEPSPAAAPKPEAPTTAPTEGAAAPEPAAPAAGPSKEEAPTPRKVTSKGGFKAPSQQGRKKGGGGGFGGARAAAPEIMKAGKEAPSLEDFKTYLYNTQGELFGKKGFETGGSDNPMEDQGPDQFEKWRGEPAEPRPGAQEGGREPATAGKGQEGQGSLLKKGTEFTKEPKARGDFKKGQKPPAQKTPSQPSPDTEPASKYNTQPSLFGKRGFDTGGSDNPLEDKAPDPYAKYRGEPTEPRPGAQEGGREPVTAGRGQEGQGSLLKKGTEFEKKPEARGDFRRGQKPKPEREGSQKPQAETPPSSSPKKPSTGNERAARLKELIDSGMSSSRALSQMRKEGSIKPKAAKKGKGKISNNAEYQEFAQSIRSMMR